MTQQPNKRSDKGNFIKDAIHQVTTIKANDLQEEKFAVVVSMPCQDEAHDTFLWFPHCFLCPSPMLPGMTTTDQLTQPWPLRKKCPI